MADDNNIGKEIGGAIGAEAVKYLEKIVRFKEQQLVFEKRIAEANALADKQEQKNLEIKTKILAVVKKIWQTMDGISGTILKEMRKGMLTVWNIMTDWRDRLDEIAYKFVLATQHLKTNVGFSKELDKTMRRLGKVTFGVFNENVQMSAEMMQSLVEEFGSIDVSKYADDMLILSKGFGVADKEAAKLLQTLTLGFDMSSTEIRETLHDIKEFSKTEKLSHVLLAKDMGENIDYFARFGKTAVKTFKGATLYASNFGLRMKELIKLSEKFDAFSDAADNVMKLNAMFGTTLNTIDMLVETDPAKRLAKIRDALLAQGDSWENLDYFQRKSLASMTGLGEAELAAVFNKKNEKKSIDDVMKAREKEASKSKNLDLEMKKSVIEMGEVFARYFGRKGFFMKLWDNLGKLFAPLAEHIWSGERSLLGRLSKMMEELSAGVTPMAKRWQGFLEGIGVWVEGLYNKAEKYLFSEGGIFSPEGFDKLIDMGSRTFNTIKDLGNTIVTIFEKLKPAIMFAVEHFDKILAGATAIKALSMGPIGVGAAVGIGAYTLGKSIDEDKARENIEKTISLYKKTLGKLKTPKLSLEEFINKKLAEKGGLALSKSMVGEDVFNDILEKSIARREKITKVSEKLAFEKAHSMAMKSLAIAKVAGTPGLTPKATEMHTKELKKMVEKGIGTSPKDIKDKFGDIGMKSELSIIKSNVMAFKSVIKEVDDLIVKITKMHDPLVANLKLAGIAAMTPKIALVAEALKTPTSAATGLGERVAYLEGQKIYIVASDIYLDSDRVGRATFGAFANK